ncbi:MAG: MFS transporter [Proteobacteria bacterium]|nr:MFS transporter [Pseudomonadota bacterium]
MKDLLQRSVLTPLVMILVIQSTITMAAYGIPVVTAVIAADMDIAPALIGGLVSVIYFVAMLTGLLSGALVGRFGARASFQAMLGFTGVGMMLIGIGNPAGMVLGAAMIGVGTGPMNPIGSHVLARVSPANWRPFIFSLKQCSTPMGGALAGAILPPLLLAYGWHVAVQVIPLAALAAIALAALVGVGPKEPRRENTGFALGDALATLILVATNPILRRYALAGLGFAGCQIAMSTYLVVYLWTVIKLAPELAGLTFSIVHIAGISARVALGAIADRWISTPVLLGLLGLIMTIGLAGLAFSTPAWPPVIFMLLAAIFGIGGNGWVGLFFSEMARRAPEGRTADAAGGSQFFMYIGITTGPIVAGALITLAGYANTFGIFAVIALFCGIILYRAAATD